MAGRDPSAGMLDVDRVEMTTRDLDAIAKLMSQLYVEHRPRFRCADPGRVDGLFQSVSAGLMRVGVNRCRGFEYGADISPVGCLVACVTLDGDATRNHAHRAGCRSPRPRVLAAGEQTVPGRGP